MAICEIKKLNSPVLRQKCEEVKEISEKVKKLIDDMIETMRENQGIGLAASQVGIKKRIIVVKSGLKDSDIFILINPKIIKKSVETEIEEEGCLSFPNMFLKIKRAKELKVEGLDIIGKKITINAKGFMARVFQHEIDHLDGILFFDHLSFFQKLKFKLKNGFN